MRTRERNRRVLVPYRHERKVKAYVDALLAGGLEPAPAFVGEAISFEGASGLLLMGGTDVNPKLYGEEARPETEAPDDQRDAVELRLIDEAIRNDIPIFAICRGIQILNVYHGGTLIQHLVPSEPHDVENEDKGAHAHQVDVETRTELARIAGRERLLVNSRHHQALKQIGAGMRVSARAADGVIEGIERADRTFVMGVQWHPEDQASRDREQLNLFRAFAQALHESQFSKISLTL
jgi:putative glutamine amidotransferase